MEASLTLETQVWSVTLDDLFELNDFRCPRITNQTLRTIGRKIKENTTNLSKLSLNFSG